MNEYGTVVQRDKRNDRWAIFEPVGKPEFDLVSGRTYTDEEMEEAAGLRYTSKSEVELRLLCAGFEIGQMIGDYDAMGEELYSIRPLRKDAV